MFVYLRRPYSPYTLVQITFLKIIVLLGEISWIREFQLYYSIISSEDRIYIREFQSYYSLISSEDRIYIREFQSYYSIISSEDRIYIWEFQLYYLIISSEDKIYIREFNSFNAKIDYFVFIIILNFLFSLNLFGDFFIFFKCRLFNNNSRKYAKNLCE